MNEYDKKAGQPNYGQPSYEELNSFYQNIAGFQNMGYPHPHPHPYPNYHFYQHHYGNPYYPQQPGYPQGQQPFENPNINPEELLAEVMALVDKVKRGEKPDVAKTMGLLEKLGSPFFKGALIGAVGVYLLTNENVRAFFMETIGGMMAGFSPENKTEE